MSAENQNDEIPLTFDEWADFSVRLLNTEPDERDRLLVEHDLLEAWGRCDLHYGTIIATDLRNGRMERAQAYAARFTSAQGAT